MIDFYCLFCGKHFKTQNGYLKHTDKHILNGTATYNRKYIIRLREYKGVYVGKRITEAEYMEIKAKRKIMELT